MEQYATKENATRLTTANVTCEVVPSKHVDGLDDLILTHKDYPFKCQVTGHAFSTYHKTNTARIFIDNSDKDAVLKSHGLNFTQGYTIRDQVDSLNRWDEEYSQIEEPRRVNLRKAEGNRLEKFYTQWFEYLNKTEWEPYNLKAEEMANKISGGAKRADKLVKATENTKRFDHEREITLRNEFCRMTLNDEMSGAKIDVTTYSMTEAQKDKLFKFLDKMSKEDK